MRIRYVLLIGDPTPDTGDLPMKMCWPNFASEYYRECPTDYYFADLTGNWDLDGDGNYGEEGADAGVGGVDFTPEVYVGRIPVYPDAGWPATLESIVQKTIRYENSTTHAWRKKALLPLSYLDPNTDEGVVGEYVKSDILQPAGWSGYTLYEQGSCSATYDSSFTSNEELLDRATINHWKNNAYGFTFWMGHGWQNGAVCCSGNIFTSDHADELNNQFPGVVFMGSCTCGHPETHNNVSYSVLKNGAIAAFGATRVSWYAGTWVPTYSHPDIAGVGYHIFNYAVRSNLTFAEAMYTTMATMQGGAAGGWWMNRMDFSMNGDPTLSFASGGVDTDGDSMDDAWETANGFNPNDATDGATDADGDGLSNAQEYGRGSDPRLSDTDLDGIGDATDGAPTTPAYAQVTLTPELTGYLSGSISGSGATWFANWLQWGVDRWNRYAGVLRFNLSSLPDAANIKGVVLRYAGSGPGWGYQTKLVGLDGIDAVTAPAAADSAITSQRRPANHRPRIPARLRGPGHANPQRQRGREPGRTPGRGPVESGPRLRAPGQHVHPEPDQRVAGGQLRGAAQLLSEYDGGRHVQRLEPEPEEHEAGRRLPVAVGRRADQRQRGALQDGGQQQLGHQLGRGQSVRLHPARGRLRRTGQLRRHPGQRHPERRVPDHLQRASPRPTGWSSCPRPMRTATACPTRGKPSTG
jgi:hypothetical protein